MNCSQFFKQLQEFAGYLLICICKHPPFSSATTFHLSPREPAIRQPVSAATEKMAFWLDRDIKEKLKILAIKERRTASDIAREVLRKYLKNK